LISSMIMQIEWNHYQREPDLTANASSLGNTQSLRDAIDILEDALQASPRKVIAVIGPQALTVEFTQPDGSTRVAPFYRLVAEQLLSEYELPMSILDEPSAAWDMHRASALILGSRDVSTQKLRIKVTKMIRQLSNQVRPAGALQALARLDCFRLVLSLTPDDLLPRAIREAQPDLTLDMAGYAPSTDLEAGWPMDVPPYAEQRLRYYQLLGRIAGDFAIHEEDTLEHLHKFRDEAERSAKLLLTDLRSRNLVYLGCGLPDWMGRGLVRLFSAPRFLSDERPFDFFCATTQDASLTGFLDQFSSNSVVLPWSPGEFVREISALSLDTPPPVRKPGNPASGVDAAAAAGAPSVFISYASENAPAARRMADQLQQLGFGEIWLDQKKLLTGDDWSDKIDDAIAGCDFFIPLLSHEADRRHEGVYWEEWRKAMGRSLRRFDAFLLPVGIDALPPAKAGYARIFTGWTRPMSDLHLLHAADGNMSSDIREQLQRRLAEFQKKQAGGRA